ncbi:protein naked cuticle isoform X2 [Lucilia cuprina]|nr:protein naked cuticle isoform X2 [Lucilia cuprina]
MYHQVRASSSCSAPPDLLLVSDRENNIPLRSPVVNIIAATTAATAPATTTTSPSSGINACHLTSVSNNNQRHHQQKLQQQHQLQQQQQQHHHHVTTQQLSLAYNGTKDMVVGNNSSSNGKHQKQTNKHGQQQQQLSQTDCQQPQQQTLQHEIEGQQLESQTNNHSSTRHAHHTQQQQSHHQQSSQQQRSDDHIRLEEFTCDVSVEGGKSSQPLQFSFTFYDLDGHHGKITKDDIVGIVYTIYESIGKSVVVPHSGSKTINVRLTVSPEGKSKASKNKKTSSAAVVLDSNQKSASQAARRLHRYRPRKLIKSDEEDDDSNSEKERDTTVINSSNLSHVLSAKTSSKAHKIHKPKANEHHCCATPNNPDLTTSPLETIYDNLKATTAVTTPEACRECLAAVDESRSAAISPIAQYHPAHAKINSSATNEAYMKHVASTRIKMLRKSRKQKHQDCMETRQRSLSVGNETCWKNRHLQKPPANSTQQQLLWHAEQQLNNSAGGVVAGATDMVDGVQLRNPLKSTAGGGGKVSSTSAQKRNSAECWKTALNRNDLISIIRESMEKNRLCFQLNGKPQANVSPIRHSQPTQQTTQTQQQHHQQHLHHNQHNSSNKHSQATTPTNSQRQRSNTVSKIPTLIANHNSAHTTHSPQHNHYPSNNGQQRSSSCVNTISNNNQHQLHDTSLPTETLNISSSNSSYHQHLQPHIPIYHQQMAINPAVIAAHNALLGGNGSGSGSAAGHHGKMNLCGYDSFLHATICGGGLSHSPPAHTSLAAQITSPLASALNSGQQIATVQPIMSTNSPNASKHLSLAVTANQIKTSKILRSGSYAQNQHHHHQQQQQHLLQTHSQTTQNSPQYHGYQRLPSSSKHNLSALHLVSPTMEKPALEQLDKWRRDQVKNYDQLLYAKLSEKLQQTNLVSTNGINSRESNPRRKHRVLRQRRPNQLIAEANNVSLSSKLKANKLCLREENDYTTILPLEEVDAVECENLLGHSSEEDTHSHNESPVHNGEKLLEDNNHKRHVAEGTLVDLDDVDDDDDEEEVQQVLTQPSSLGNHAINADTLLRVENDEVHHLHLEDNLEIEEDLEEDLDDDLEEDVDEVVANGAVNESGRNSAASNDSNPTGATLANTNGAANTSTTSSSLIHRYVHEHIHHHYHHFEEKEE